MKFQTSNEKPSGTMADERTPLIQTVDVRPHRDRYPHHRLRAVCTGVLSAVVVVGCCVAASILILAPLDGGSDTEVGWSITAPFAAPHVPDGWGQRVGLKYEDLQSILLDTPDADRAREWSRYYTSGPHLAGKNFSQALWTKERWQEFGIENTVITDYEVYVNYPKGHRLALLKKTKGHRGGWYESSKNRWKVKYEASLEEDVLKQDKASQLADRVPTFHGYSASGNVTAPYVFVNYGTYKDFEELQAAKIDLKGKIALVKYGGIFRGLKVKRAQELGMVGVVMYTDPGDDGDVTEKNGNASYPKGPARNPSSVQRGSVQFLSRLPG